jgi:hypothetical protein
MRRVSKIKVGNKREILLIYKKNATGWTDLMNKKTISLSKLITSCMW